MEKFTYSDTMSVRFLRDKSNEILNKPFNDHIITMNAYMQALAKRKTLHVED